MVATRASSSPRRVVIKRKPMTGKNMAGLMQFNGARDDILKRIGFPKFSDFITAIRVEYAKPKYPKTFEGWNKARDAVLKLSGIKGYRGLMAMAKEENAAFAHTRPGAFARATAGRSPTKPRGLPRAPAAAAKPRAVRPRA